MATVSKSKKDDKGNLVLACPECENNVQLADDYKAEVGDIIECNHCATELEVALVGDDGFEVEIIEEEK